MTKLAKGQDGENAYTAFGAARVYSTEVGTIEHLATREVGGWSQHYCPIAFYRHFTYSSLVNSSHR